MARTIRQRNSVFQTNKHNRLSLLFISGLVSFVGEGVFEMREYFGPDWRMYYTKRGDTLIIMLGGGGDKGSQESDRDNP